MISTVINGRHRNYSNVRINALGATWVGVTKISYKRKDNIEAVKVLGATKGIGYVQGDEQYSGSIGMLSELRDSIQAKLPKGKTLQDIPPFPITVSYVDDMGLQVCHVLYGCKFMENGNEAEAGGNGAMIVESELFISNIDFNA